LAFVIRHFPRHLAFVIRHFPGLRHSSLLPSFCLLLCAAALARATTNDPWAIDFRYAPAWWETAICLPDDWQKTLVGKEGSLLYDYPGRYQGFGTRITFGLAREAKWVKQELESPRVPIVRTFLRSEDIEVEQDAFAVAPPLVLPRQQPKLVLERVDSQVGEVGWASPPRGSDPAFSNVAIGFGHPVHYRFKAKKSDRYTVAFGLCEGYHGQAGQRILVLQMEGKPLRKVDMVAEKGRNQPALFSFPARDENGDGWVDLAVSAVTNSPDTNTILNALWIFRGDAKPDQQALLAGRSTWPALAHLDCGADTTANKPRRHDLVLVHMRNTGATPASVSPTLTIESSAPMAPDAFRRLVQVGGSTTVSCSRAILGMEENRGRLVLRFPEGVIPAHGEGTLSFVVARGRDAGDRSFDFEQGDALLHKAEEFWRRAALPHDRLEIPDPGVQALLDSSIRNIYQAREIKDGLPAFQVGPTCYRGLWVVDGSFLLEAMTYLGREDETRNGIKYLMSFQRKDGSFMLMDAHWKETGIALWAITRHARLTGDKGWLLQAWPNVERGFAFIRHMRTMPGAFAPNARLIPDGFSDGGLGEKVPEYTNIYWTLAGLRAAIESARWLGKVEEAEDWQKEYDDFLQTFRRAAERDTRMDAHGNRYLPIRMNYDPAIPPQKAQWAFLHSLFPGKVFSADDPLVLGNMAMLKAAEKEGLVQDTGWLKGGLWTYFGSFYGHAWLWLRDGDKAARTLYAFGNHASPLLAWREEQMPAGQGSQVVGDMPHNWASAEFIRLVRHMLILERGNELHLFEGVPAKWARPGAVIQAKDIATEFGPVSLELRVAKNGSSAVLKLTPPQRTSPTRIVLHLANWSGKASTLDLPIRNSSRTEIRMYRSAAP
jgi:hypothetical protein